jgi:chorismate-pyruvate lyase
MVPMVRSDAYAHPGSSSPTPTAILVDALDSSAVTVTEFIESLVGEQILADKIEHSELRAREGDRLDVEAGSPLRRRVAVLRGRQTWHPYVGALTLMVPDRLPDSVIHRLEATDEPIGRVLTDHGLTAVRRDLAAVTPSSTIRLPADVLYARQYRLDVGGRPAMFIREWFLADITPFLTPR